MNTQDQKQIKQLIQESILESEKKFETKKDLENAVEKLNKERDEDFKSDRKYIDRKFDQVITILKQLQAGAFSFDSRLNNHESRIQKLEEASVT